VRGACQNPVIAAIFRHSPWPGGFEFAAGPAIFVSLRDGRLPDRIPGGRTLGLVPGAGGTPKACHAPSERRARRSCTSSWAIPSLHVKPKGRGLGARNREAARLSIAQWRLHSACRHIHRNPLLTSSVSSATPPRRRWHRGLALERKSLLEIVHQRTRQLTRPCVPMRGAHHLAVAPRLWSKQGARGHD